MNLNKAIIIGRVVATPQRKKLTNGNSLTEFSVATNRVRIKEDGTKSEEVTYHNVICFGKLGDSCGQWLQKGQEVMIEGAINNRSWDKPDGSKGYRSEIIANNVQFGSRGVPQNTVQKPKDEPVIEYDEPKAKTAPASKEVAKTGVKVAGTDIDYPDDDINPGDIPF